MFNELSIVSTAISSFNNAALVAPLFFSLALLMLPIFFGVYLYGNDFVAKIGWKKSELQSKIGFFSGLILMMWLMIFGGNYAVIRDGISLLSLCVSVVLFVLSAFVVHRAVLLKYTDKIRDKKTAWLILLSVLVLAGFSGAPTLFGVLLPMVAVFCGMLVGARIKSEFDTVSLTSLLFGTVSVLILMQPEYFRFGQLANLTIIHIFALLFVGFCAVSVLTTKYTPARSKIYQSAYIKLKWLFRIISILAFVLFVSTESVPVFVGLLGAIGLSEMLTIYHSGIDFRHVAQKMWACLLIGFGILIICPVISAMGIIYLTEQSGKIKISDFTDLL